VSRARLLALSVAVLACASRPSEAAVPEPTGKVIVETARGGRHEVAVEIARTDAARMRGLMYRTALAPEAGMLFLFEESAPHGFWMRNTLIPLDMIFIDEGGVVVEIVERAEPRTEVSRGGNVPSRYVLEVNGGWVAAKGVRVGDRVRFEKVFF
jgi:uncharacterized membrane protein (UPF0127 family)